MPEGELPLREIFDIVRHRRAGEALSGSGAVGLGGVLLAVAGSLRGGLLNGLLNGLIATLRRLLCVGALRLVAAALIALGRVRLIARSGCRGGGCCRSLLAGAEGASVAEDHGALAALFVGEAFAVLLADAGPDVVGVVEFRRLVSPDGDVERDDGTVVVLLVVGHEEAGVVLDGNLEPGASFRDDYVGVQEICEADGTGEFHGAVVVVRHKIVLLCKRRDYIDGLFTDHRGSWRHGRRWSCVPSRAVLAVLGARAGLCGSCVVDGGIGGSFVVRVGVPDGSVVVHDLQRGDLVVFVVGDVLDKEQCVAAHEDILLVASKFSFIGCQGDLCAFRGGIELPADTPDESCSFEGIAGERLFSFEILFGADIVFAYPFSCLLVFDADFAVE